MRSFGRSVFTKSSVGAAAAVVLASLFTSGPAVATPTQESVPTGVAAPAFTPTLTYVACPVDEKLPPRTKCAALTVPLDWQSPDDGRTIDIAVRITRAKNNPGSNGLTWNIGGPGAAVVEGHRDFYSKLPASIRKNFDWVSFDPRGVGLSEPKLAGCTPGAGGLPPLTGPVDWDAHWTNVEATDGAAAAACFDANPDAAPYMGTWQVVRDMDALRASLRYDRWNYWGMSYGTRIGHAYARTFPSSLRALIMDGSLMAGETVFRFGTTLPGGVEVALQVYASIVGKAQAHKINAIFDYLDVKTLNAGGTRVSRWELAPELRTLLTEQAQYPVTRRVIDKLYKMVKAKTRDQKSRAAYAARDIWALLPRANDPSTTIRLINCADLLDRPTAEQLAAAASTVIRDYGNASMMYMGNAAMCAGLPSDLSPASPRGTSPIKLANPPMFVLSTGDAATPWAWGRSMANSFTGSRTISYTSTQHVTYLFTPSTCVNDTVTRYLLTLKPPRGDISCPFAPPQ